MIVVSEPQVRELISEQEALEAVEAVFKSMDAGDARNFPVVREVLGYEGAIFGIKSAFDAADKTLGLKCGGYWPGNAAKELTNHQSTILLLDAGTGMPVAMVAANFLTAIRTAAATAVSVKTLSRADASILGVVGAGNQAVHQIRAIARVRTLRQIHIWNRTESKSNKLREAVNSIAPAKCCRPQEVAENADILLTITSASEPLVQHEWIRPGTHIAAMGVDTAGKQELDPRIVANAKVFADSREQVRQIGECQHAVKQGLIDVESITEIGAVLNGKKAGRTSNRDVTLFDGTGVALQDLAVASRVIKRLHDAGIT